MVQDNSRDADGARRGLRILLAEDNELAAILVSRHLARLGHASMVAGNGAEALRLLSEQPYDLALMDLQMPIMDGLEATERLRNGEAGELNRHLPVVALTAHALDEYKESCRAVGMSDFITKPVEMTELDKTIERVLENRPQAAFQAAKQEAPPREIQDLAPAEARRRLGVDKELFSAIVTAALDECQSKIWACDEALTQGDAGEAHALAHTLKSTAASMGADRCSQLARELQASAKAGDMDRARGLLRELEEAFALVQSLIEDGALDRD